MKKNLVFLLIGVIVLVGLYIVIKPKSSPKTDTNSTAVSSQASKNTEASGSASLPNSMVFNLEVRNNKLVSGPDTLKVAQGDQVTIRILADVDGELHLHGYDKHIDFKKGVPAELSVKADTSGRFPYELEDTKAEIGALEVLPK